MSKIFKKLNRRESGFTLIEIIVAVAILAILGVGLLGSLILSSQTLLRADTRETARDLAQAQMEDIQGQIYIDTASVIDDPTQYALLSSGGYTITATTGRVDTGAGTTIDTGLQKITISVQGPKGEFTLVGYKVR